MEKWEQEKENTRLQVTEHEIADVVSTWTKIPVRSLEEGEAKRLMNLENVRILKEMRNSVNRKVNCETANISKTVAAAVKQLGDIEYIKQNAGLDSLPENLKEMALLRLEYPDTPLKELGTYLDPPVGKSGVNHRLRRISEIADELREKE